jgi:hypothetical protein
MIRQHKPQARTRTEAVKGRAMAQAVSPGSIPDVHVGSVVDKLALGQVFL